MLIRYKSNRSQQHNNNSDKKSWRLHDAREKEIKGLKSYVVKHPF